MLYVVMRYEDGGNIKNIFQSYDSTACSEFLINDFKKYCKEKDIDYMVRDLEHPELETKDPTVFDAMYEKHEAFAYNERTMCKCIWDIVEIKV